MRGVLAGAMRRVSRPRIIAPAVDTAIVAVLPVAAVSGSLRDAAVTWLCVYPFCHLARRWRYLRSLRKGDKVSNTVWRTRHAANNNIREVTQCKSQ